MSSSRTTEEARRVEVTIMGQRLVLKGTHDPRHVERLAAYVKRKVDEVGLTGNITSPKLAVLTALNIADDYFRALEDARSFKREVVSRSRELLRELDEDSE